MANVRTEEVKLTVDGSEMRSFLALPEAAGPRPAVLVFQEIFGINAHIQDVTKRIAAEGYVAIAPDYHHRAWAPGTRVSVQRRGHEAGHGAHPEADLRRHPGGHRCGHRLF